jgi:hypothetical protein
MAEVVERLPIKFKAQTSYPSIAETNKTKRTIKVESKLSQRIKVRKSRQRS